MFRAILYFPWWVDDMQAYIGFSISVTVLEHSTEVKAWNTKIWVQV